MKMNELVYEYLKLRDQGTELEKKQEEIAHKKQLLASKILALLPEDSKNFKGEDYTVSRTIEVETTKGMTTAEKNKLKQWAKENDCVALSWSLIKSAVKQGKNVPFLAGKTRPSVSIYDRRNTNK